MKPIFFFSAYKRPIEEFNGILNQLGRPYVKFYDSSTRWYMDEHWKEEIQEALNAYGQPIMSLGYSMGGWAALYHQPQIKAEKVVAFGPQGTTISKEMRNIGGKFSKTFAKDLKTVKGSRLPPPVGDHTIYFANFEDTGIGDSGHERLIIEAGYTTTKVDVPVPNEHDIVSQLYKQGVLVDIIKSHLDK